MRQSFVKQRSGVIPHGLFSARPLRRGRDIRVRWMPLDEPKPADTTKPGRYAVTILKPLQMTLADKPDVGVVVDSLEPNGRAAQAGLRVGDIVEECSIVVLEEDEGHVVIEDAGQSHRPTFDHFKKVMFKCAGQDFETVMHAIRSNSTRWGFKDVDLVIRRPEPVSA